MEQPDRAIVFISRSRINDGQQDALRELIKENTPRLEVGKPLTHAFLPYEDEEATTLTIVHVFRSAEAFDSHLEGAAARSRGVADFIKTTEYEVYGPVNDVSLATLQENSGPGVPIRRYPTLVGGFVRNT